MDRDIARLECTRIVVSNPDCFIGHTIYAANELADFVLDGKLPGVTTNADPHKNSCVAGLPAQQGLKDRPVQGAGPNATAGAKFQMLGLASLKPDPQAAPAQPLSEASRSGLGAKLARLLKDSEELRIGAEMQVDELQRVRAARAQVIADIAALRRDLGMEG